MGGRPPKPIGAGGGRAATGSALFFRACAARRRSAGVPCRSPLPSFLNAYWTAIALFMRYCPFIASTAASDDSKSVYATKPYPFDSPVLGSRAICEGSAGQFGNAVKCRGVRTFAVVAIMPNALNVSYSNLSSTFSSRLPMNRFAPTSSCFLSDDA